MPGVDGVSTFILCVTAYVKQISLGLTEYKTPFFLMLLTSMDACHVTEQMFLIKVRCNADTSTKSQFKKPI